MLGKKRNLLTKLILGCLILIPLSAQGQDEKLKAIFVYNFTRYIDWPAKPGNFVILILGKSPIYSELADVALKKRVGNTPIEVRNITSSQEVGDCHIVYVTSSKSDQLPALLSVSEKKNILVITEKEDACDKGAGINFVNLNGKLTFEISKLNLSKSGLVVSSAFYALGSVVSE